MMRTCFFIVTAVSLLVVAPAHLSLAQAGPELGDDFIFFRNGYNLRLASTAGNIEMDPASPSEISVRFDYGDWSYQSFGWDPAVGVDMTANNDANNILHLRLRVDAANAGKSDTFLMLEDKTNGQLDDLPMRLAWRIPEAQKDGMVHQLEIPLPPQICTDLASQRGTLVLADHWWYGGSWHDPTQTRIGGYDDDCGSTQNAPQHWKEFEWTNVKSIGVFWDHNTGGGSIWIDDVFIGPSGLDLTKADAVPTALSSIKTDTTGGVNTVSWTHDPLSDVFAYKVFAFALNPPNPNLITSGALPPLGVVNASASEQQLVHHPHFLSPDLVASAHLQPTWYGITTISEFAVENFDVSNSNSFVVNPHLPVAPIIAELIEDEVSVLESDLAAGIASNAGFDVDWDRFIINQERFRLADANTPPDDDNDLSGTFYLGYTQDQNLYFYAEVLDDQVELPPSENPSQNPWEYDVIEIGWSNYWLRPDNMGVTHGDFILGSFHTTMERGEFADYHLRIGGKGDGSEAFVWVEPGTGGIPSESQTHFNTWEDGQGNTIGYKILARIPLDGIQNSTTNDAVVVVPSATGGQSRAINIVLSDRDGGVRESQIQWSLKPSASGDWWRTPSQWEPIGIAGRQRYPVAAEAETPDIFTLDQNYPNPFNPTTSIRFTLTKPEQVTLRVIDVLGREVSKLIDSQLLGSGTHVVTFDGQALASGIYFYTIQAGTSPGTTKRMVLIK